VSVLVLKPHRLSRAGHIGDAFVDRGVELVDHVLSEDETPPSIARHQAMLVMGAPWSVYGDEVAPWIDGASTRSATRSRAMSRYWASASARRRSRRRWADARPADDQEVGWRTVQTTDPKIVPEGPWFMWHGDTFDLPPGATAVASTSVGVQAFTMGPHLCVQFHPEATPEMIEDWLAHSDADFRRAGIDPADVLEETRRREPEAKARAAALVDRFLSGPRS
jgi:GMP synthase-like glutamine amidotransferase